MFNEKQIGFYAGSFDPLTKGHWNFICDAICRCDKVYIGVGINDKKTPLFSESERIELIQKTINDFMLSYKYKKINKIVFSETEKKAYNRLSKKPDIVEAVSYKGLTIDNALKLGATSLLRGERNSSDHEYEASISTVNHILLKVRQADLGFITLTPANQKYVEHISSSSTKVLCDAGEYVATEEYVTPSVHNELVKKYIREEFIKTSKAFGIKDKDVINEEYDSLTDDYSNNRLYHNLSHIASCLNYLNIYEAIENKLSKDDRMAIVMAIFYHDIEQEENTEKSKKRLEKYIGNHRLLDKSLSCIDATEHLEREGKTLTSLQELMSDLDLSILGSPSRYPIYAQAIREEYKQYPDDVFAETRMNLLKTILDSEQIYYTEFFDKMFTKNARENILEEQTLWTSVILEKVLLRSS